MRMLFATYSPWMRFPKKWIIRCCFRPTIRAAASTISRISCLFPRPRWNVGLDAAQRSAALASGRSGHPHHGAKHHRMSPEQTQDIRVDELPIGTRGGQRSHRFPAGRRLCGEDRSIRLPVSRIDRGQCRRGTVDTVTIGDNTGGRGRGGHSGRGGGDGDKPVEIRVPIKAGPRLIGVAFVQRTEARRSDSATAHARQSFQPAMLNVTISGPYDAKGSGRH